MRIAPLAKVHAEPDGFCVLLHPPNDPDNFIVLFRTKKEEEADMLCGSFNSVAEECVRAQMESLLRSSFESFMAHNGFTVEDD